MDTRKELLGRDIAGLNAVEASEVIIVEPAPECQRLLTAAIIELRFPE